MENVEIELASQAGGVLERAYDDMVHPSAASVGNTISLIPRTIGVLLGKWEKWVINGEESIKRVTEAIGEKAANIPEERICDPEPYVAVPAIQQISYCFDSAELRDMYANLLVSSMDEAVKDGVHPGFVGIIQQLTPDEAKLLRQLPRNSGKYVPVIDLNIKTEGEPGYRTILRSYSDICNEVCEHPENVSAYLENLARLKIIEMPGDGYIVDDAQYKRLENSPTIVALKKRIPLDNNQKYETKRRLLYVTSFGATFLECCVYGFDLYG